MRREQVGKAGAALAAVALVATMSGCGRGDGSGQVAVGGAKVEALAAAADKTDGVDTATFHFTATDTSSEGGDQELSGSIDRANHLAETRSKVSGGSDAEGSALAGGSDVVVDGQVVYLHTAGMDQVFHVSTPWVSGDLAAWRSSAWSMVVVTSDPFTLFSPQRDTFDGVMAFLRTISGGVSKVGTDTVDGTSTTHYQARLDMRVVESEIGRLLAQTTGTSLDDGETVSTEPGTLTVDVWIDGGGLIRRFVATGPTDDSSSSFSDGTVSTTRTNGSTTLTFDLLTVGQPVHVAVPPADQVTEVDFSKTNPFGDVPVSGLPASTSTTTG